MTISLLVNRQRHTVPAAPETPLLYVLRNDLALNGAKFGCGQAQCGACTVMLGKTPVRSCVFPVGAVRGEPVTTVEGLGTPEHPHPLQQAFIAEQAAQCGYCSSGMLMAARALLEANPHADESAVRAALAGQKCRCGAHNRIVRAVLRAAEAMRA
ncbi:(2Fe-2S)-binding protein [Paraburkholderia caribensis]|jgi:nicotinate dehydrogenase subunit A|uniref:(2Fe-2S)-binding protein n=1 Tax=Paraburkholderia caribensis TaxID=75105 RepID=UPI00078C2A87|nr:(2Fe-2S)-binding protein [Paraburkholderia caribensis]AMV48962.1 (2Fe-2S)-binding protein [Paraburkholderia caribensis]AUT57570.1 (2Fe-2S)-binding protein [Paraburkholderia caribensis]MDR6380865.1 nicotinate dehydrogenase subunit A [Paraburkholderia caribensis]CAG9225025.1 Nicotinate dehydrogenase subunit A [Paraburkholderia caribensis]